MGGVSGLMKANGIRVIKGVGSLGSGTQVNVKSADGASETLEADAVIIAAGSVPAVPPIPGLEGNGACVNSTGALSFENVPKSLLVIGGGVIGLELATAYNAFGSAVTVVEAMPKLLPMMDGELTDALRFELAAQGIAIHTSAKVVSIDKSPAGASVVVELDGKEQRLEAEKVLVAVGRRANTAGLGLDKAGVDNDRGRIKVDSHMRTSVPNVYAVGDCLGKVMLAHTAFAQGRAAAENAMGFETEYDEKTNPSCVYTEPEFAKVGLTEEELKASGIEYTAGRFPLAANGKSVIENGGKGMIKLLFGKKYGELLGAHILGPRATDLIGECALALRLEATADELIDTIHAHPTVHEAIQEAALAAERRAIHMPNK